MAIVVETIKSILKAIGTLNQAAKWNEKAADQGDSYAQWMLSVMYYNGEGVSQDYAKAKDWCKKAAA